MKMMYTFNWTNLGARITEVGLNSPNTLISCSICAFVKIGLQFSLISSFLLVNGGGWVVT